VTNRCLPLLFAGVALPSLLAAAEFDAAVSTNEVGLALYRQLAAQKPGENLVLAPYSIESALALAYAGADADTRTEMARVLHLPLDNAALQAGFAGLRSALDQIAQQSKTAAETRRQHGGKTDVIDWHAANRLYGQTGYAFRQEFITLMKEGFAAPFEAVDFRGDAERTREAINAWVDGQTRRKIRDLIPRGGLDRDTRLVLVNALYLKAPWETPFEKTGTQPRPFHQPGGRTREVPTMHRSGLLGYAAEEGLTAVALDYLGGGLRFLVLLPNEGEDIDALAARLTPEHFARWARLGETTNPVSVSLYLPKFRVEGTTIPLGRELRALGVKRAFDEPRGSANFDRIAPRQPNDYLAISEVFHQTFIELDEEGTEAAAATAVVMRTLSAALPPPKPIEVRVDRPFLFAIQHRASGTCLFFGRISDPR
jgi:serpin B